MDALEASSSSAWNRWRKAHPALRPDLRGLDLKTISRAELNLPPLDLHGARLAGARLSGLRAWSLRLEQADLRHANLDRCDLSYARLRGANLEGCRLVQSNLTLIDAAGASFRNANLSHAIMNGADLRGADLSGARVAGLSAWDIRLDGETRQKKLLLEEVGDFLEDVVDDEDLGTKPVVGRVDHVEAVSLIYLLKDKAKFKTVIDAMTNTVVLILGNFEDRRLQVLHDIETTLRSLGYVPVIFDFDAPVDRDLVETVALLAGLSSFVVADLTHPRSTPLEAMLITPQLRVPFVTVVEKGERPFEMLRSLQAKYSWVLPTVTYSSRRALVRLLKTRIVPLCERTRTALRTQRRVRGA
jgi:uncharacterized protein YjbI with pentapeptide repeats